MTTGAQEREPAAKPPADAERYPVLKDMDLTQPTAGLLEALPGGWDAEPDGTLIPPEAHERWRVAWNGSGEIIPMAAAPNDEEITEGFPTDEGSIVVEAKGTDTWTGEQRHWSVTKHPEEPPCREPEEEKRNSGPIGPNGTPAHDWNETDGSPAGHGGGVIVSERCRRCGTIRHTDTWHEDPVYGLMDEAHVRYETEAQQTESRGADGEER